MCNYQWPCSRSWQQERNKNEAAGRTGNGLALRLQVLDEFKLRGSVEEHRMRTSAFF